MGLLSCPRSSISTAILVALWAKTPQPHHVRAPSMPSILVRSQPQECLRYEIRPSDPVRHLTSLRKRRADSTAWRAAPGRPLRGMATWVTPSSWSSVSTLASP